MPTNDPPHIVHELPHGGAKKRFRYISEIPLQKPGSYSTVKYSGDYAIVQLSFPSTANSAFSLFPYITSQGTNMATTLKTASLGEIQGKDANSVTQYLGIKYATLRNRLAGAELVRSRDGNTLDATRDGYV